MKKLSLVTVFLIVLCISASSQLCPDSLYITSQAQIDSFQINYPGCTEIDGNVEIYGNDITNLNGLNVLTAIGGHLYISDLPVLTNLMGLENLVYIGGRFMFGGNEALTSFTGLDNLASIGGDLYVILNPAPTSFAGLENLASIGGDLWIQWNDALTSLTGLEGLGSIGGFLHIAENFVLTDLSSMGSLTSVGGYLYIGGNVALTSLIGLDNVTSIGGDLMVWYNLDLTSLTGLDNIVANSIDSLYIIENPSLSYCEVQSVCDYLIAPGGTIEIYDNAAGCNSQTEVGEACDDVSVEEMFLEDYLSLYPNPAHEELNILIDDGREPTEVSIYTLTGQQVIHERPVDGTINISHLQSGMYIVVVTVEGRKVRQKILVQR